MATMQHCVDINKAKGYVLDSETCKFKPKPKPPILKKGRNIFEVKENLPSGLNAELGDFSKREGQFKNYENTKNQFEPLPDNQTETQIEKEENQKLAIAQLQPTNNASKLGKIPLQNVIEKDTKGTRHSQTRWSKKNNPANVRTSINILRKTRAKKRRNKYTLQELNVSKRVQEHRAKVPKGTRKTRIQARKAAEARAMPRVPVIPPRRQKQEPVPTNNVVAKRFQARKADAIRLKELEKETKLAELKAKANRLQAEGDLLAQELGSNSGSNANLRPN